MIKITSTKDFYLRGIKCLVYGESGVGKTVLCSTAPDPIIISAESGLLSLRKKDIPVIEINSLKTLRTRTTCLKEQGGKNLRQYV